MNKIMSSQRMDERADDEGDDIDKRPVVVEICELRNTETKKKNLSTTAVLDIDTMITINKCMPGVDNSDDDASAVTVATKHLCEEKYNKQMDIPEGFFDTDTTQAVDYPKQKKYRKRRPNQHQKKQHGKQATNSTEGTEGTKRDHTGDQQEDQSNLSGNGGNRGNNSNNQQNEDTNKLSRLNDERYPGNLDGDVDIVDVEDL